MGSDLMSLGRRGLLRATATMSAMSGIGLSKAIAHQGGTMQANHGSRQKMVGFMLAHEQFPVPKLGFAA